MTFDLTGKTAIVTGASSGIGRATALALSEAGANVVITARRIARLQEVQATSAHPDRMMIVEGDARSSSTAERAAQAAMQKFGQIDILVNNAGIGRYKPLPESQIADYEEIMDSNMRSTFLFTREVIPHMLKQASGTVLAVSSMAGLYGYPNETIYCASKFAQVGFIQSLDKEFRTKGIRAGAIRPGAAITEFAIGEGRIKEDMEKSGMLLPEDVADAILFACCQPPHARIIELQVRSMREPLTGPGV